MPDITVQPHGDRWAVFPAGAESPTEEHETREAAELSARALADGGEVHVREQDPTHLDQAEETVAEGEPKRGSVPPQRLPNAIDAGL